MVSSVLAGLEDQTANQLALVGTLSLLIGGVFGWLGRGIGFALSRWWTGAGKRDHAQHLNAVADLASKMRANGMTLDEVRQFEIAMNDPAVTASFGVGLVVDDLTAWNDEEPSAFHSNAAMKARAGSAYAVAEAQLEQALTDFRLMIGEHEWEHVAAAQGHWRSYRLSLEDAALREWDGGTHATLAVSLVGLAETERRTAEVRAQISARSAQSIGSC